MMAGRHPQDADLWRNQWAESIPDGMRPAPLNLGGACAELEWQKDNLRVLAAALAERKVWFWGCGAAYAAFKQLFSATKPLGILADLSTAGGNPPAIDGLAVMHPESIDPRKGKFPVVVFARQEHVETIREKLTTRYRELVDQSMIVYCVL
jgi:hypothetical protein